MPGRAGLVASEATSARVLCVKVMAFACAGILPQAGYLTRNRAFHSRRPVSLCGRNIRSAGRGWLVCAARGQSHSAPSDMEQSDVELGGGVQGHRVCIEYCRGCRWGLRASWVASELLVTFDGIIGEVAIRPGTRAGIFDVWVVPENGEQVRVWCRKDAGRFPELKELKQHIRDILSPRKDLGHSDCKQNSC